MPEILVECEVWCSCGEGLCSQSDCASKSHRRSRGVVVEPCKKCIKAARDEGYNERDKEAP